MKLKCLHCSCEFDGTVELDELGWHSSCPKCGCSFDVDVYYVVQTETHDIDNPWIRSAWEVNSFYELDKAMKLAQELCDDIIDIAKEHKDNGDHLESICVLRVVENAMCLRVEEEVVFRVLC